MLLCCWPGESQALPLLPNPREVQRLLATSEPCFPRARTPKVFKYCAELGGDQACKDGEPPTAGLPLPALLGQTLLCAMETYARLENALAY